MFSFQFTIPLRKAVHLTYTRSSLKELCGRNAIQVTLQLRCRQQTVCVNHTCVINMFLSPAPILSLFTSQMIIRGARAPSATLHLPKESWGRMMLRFVLAVGLVLSFQPQQCGGEEAPCLYAFPQLDCDSQITVHWRQQHQRCRESTHRHLNHRPKHRHCWTSLQQIKPL